MYGKWKLKIDLYSGSFAGVQSVAQRALEQVVKAKSVRDLRCIGAGGGGGGDPVGFGYTVTLECPIEEKIAQLRKEADELEATLLKEPS